MCTIGRVPELVFTQTHQDNGKPGNIKSSVWFHLVKVGKEKGHALTRPNCKNCGWACQLASNKSPLRGKEKEKEKQKYTHTHTLYYYVLLCIYAFPLNNETRERETFFLWSSSVNNPNNALAGKWMLIALGIQSKEGPAPQSVRISDVSKCDDCVKEYLESCVVRPKITRSKRRTARNSLCKRSQKHKFQQNVLCFVFCCFFFQVEGCAIRNNRNQRPGLAIFIHFTRKCLRPTQPKIGIKENENWRGMIFQKK